MSKESFNKKPVYIVTALLIISSVSYQIYHGKIRRRIEKTGINVHAVVTKVVFSRGYITDIKYICNGSVYKNYFTTDDFKPHVGDSVAIKILQINPDEDFIFEGRFYAIPVVYKSNFDWLHRISKNL